MTNIDKTQNHPLPSCCVGLRNAAAVPARPDDGDSVDQPVLGLNEPHHHVIFENDMLRVFRVLIPAGGTTLWHAHNYDFAVAGIAGTKLHVETRGHPQAMAGELVTDSISFTPYGSKHDFHRIHNISDTLNHQLAMEILLPKPGTFQASDRTGAPQYTQEIDNSRIRAFRLRLAPGEIAPMVFRSAPVLRIILQGERLIETNAHDMGVQTMLHRGDAFWLGSPGFQSLVNAAEVPLELLEVELK